MSETLHLIINHILKISLGIPKCFIDHCRALEEGDHTQRCNNPTLSGGDIQRNHTAFTPPSQQNQLTIKWQKFDSKWKSRKNPDKTLKIIFTEQTSILPLIIHGITLDKGLNFIPNTNITCNKAKEHFAIHTF